MINIVIIINNLYHVPYEQMINGILTIVSLKYIKSNENKYQLLYLRVKKYTT